MLPWLGVAVEQAVEQAERERQLRGQQVVRVQMAEEQEEREAHQIRQGRPVQFPEVREVLPEEISEQHSNSQARGITGKSKYLTMTQYLQQ
jgi:hypothetical protein